MKRFLICAAVTIVPMAAFAASPVKPGEWSITSHMEMTGMPMQIPPTTVTICITKEDAEKAEATVPKGRGDCKVADFKMEGNKASWTMDCTSPRGGKTHAVGQATYNSDSYSGKMDIKTSGPNGEHEIHSTFEGKRISETCSK